MVRLQTLDLRIGVRVPASQPLPVLANRQNEGLYGSTHLMGADQPPTAVKNTLP